MSHNVFSRRPNLWTSATVINARDLSLWDLNQFKGVDGDNGGTWTPKMPIGIGGAGVQLSDNSFLSGGFQTALGGRAVLGASDFPIFSASSRTRTVRFPLRGLPGSTGFLLKQNFEVGGRPIHRSGWFDPNAAVVWFPIDPRFMHDGANIAAVRVYGFQTQFLPILSSPATVLQVRFYRVDGVVATFNVTAQWIPSHNYTLGTNVLPLGAQTQTGLYYTVTTAGMSSGAGQPNPWPSVIGNTVVDGGVTWTATAAAGTIPQASPYYANSYYNNGLPWTIVTNPAYLGTPPTGSASHSWSIGITQDAASWCWTAAEIDYTAIPNMSFA
jgi:hypothetical protein